MSDNTETPVRQCHTCAETMSEERFQEGKMCCDKPLFGDDDEEEWEARKIAGHTCHTCVAPLVAGKVVWGCGSGRGNGCETWYCDDCDDDSTCCEMCKPEEEDGWEEVYEVVEGVDDLLCEWPSHNRFRTTADSVTTYYQTYGGGPEGGYFVKREKPACATGCGCEIEVYSVKRTWWEPFVGSLLPGYTLEFEEPHDKPARLKITTPHGAW